MNQLLVQLEPGGVIAVLQRACDHGAIACGNGLCRVREAMRWGGVQALPGGGLGPFALKAQTTLTGGTFTFSGVNVELDGNVGEGVLSLATNPRTTLKGTLAADSLDLTPYLANAEILRASERDWSRSSISADGLANFDLDLRLSAARVTVADMRFMGGARRFFATTVVPDRSSTR